MKVELNVADLHEKRTREHSTASDEAQTVKGWKISERQCELITLGDRAAVDKFFEDNLARLTACVRKYLHIQRLYNNGAVALLEVDDLINQVYVDMRCGYLVMDMQCVGALAWRSFRFAGVGGFGDELGAYTYKPRKRSKAVQ